LCNSMGITKNDTFKVKERKCIIQQYTTTQCMVVSAYLHLNAFLLYTLLRKECKNFNGNECQHIF
jgi:hypothetical protein